MRTFLLLLVALLVGFVLPGTPLHAQDTEFDPDTVQAGPLDNGRMWMFENPPIDYLEATYDFRPDSAWFEDARLSALRIPGCSASFVSPNGLVVTNHHCTRGSISGVSQEGEDLLSDGFYAATMEAERPIPDYYVEQLVGIEDVTDAVYAALEEAETDAERAEARRAATEQIGDAVAQDYGGDAVGINVDVVSLYNGGLYSAYVFKRYTDVRLVAAPELQMGYFGGDADNFTYPRYSLDFAFLRVYDEDGAPMQTDHYFTWTDDGISPEDLIFVIGNPGSTTRLATVAQLTYLRDVQVPAILRAITDRIEAMQAYARANPEVASRVRNQLFGLLNAQKAYRGRVDALQDPYIIARRAAAEEDFREAIQGDPDLRAAYGGLIDRMADIQQQKREQADAVGAFLLLGNSSYSSATLRRAMLAAQYRDAMAAGAKERAAEVKDNLLQIPDQPPALERRLLTVRFEAFRDYFGPEHAITQAALQGRTPEAAAAAMLETSLLASSETAEAVLGEGTLKQEDPAVGVAQAMLPRLREYQSALAGLGAQEDELASQLGRARFEVYGTAVPPDATFSLRITDGVVKGYEYNGTVAPPYTTFYGLYDHYHSYGADTEWALPERWRTPPAAFDLQTPLNFVSTSDTIGGNSGSPAINREQELVGLNFDRNIEGLVRDYIFLPERGRNIMVDARAVQEALDVIYDADRIVQELMTGQLYATEAEADAAMGTR
ncbi:MAG: S46 family peptidase [Bacteroidetes bacterium]|jgi:hypothetical protein|nr:S46 family peptidase [Bacteroidota bacterium]